VSFSQDDKQWMRDFFTSMMVPQFDRINRRIDKLRNTQGPTDLIIGLQEDFSKYAEKVNMELKALKRRGRR